MIKIKSQKSGLINPDLSIMFFFKVVNKKRLFLLLTRIARPLMLWISVSIRCKEIKRRTSRMKGDVIKVSRQSLEKILQGLIEPPYKELTVLMVMTCRSVSLPRPVWSCCFKSADCRVGGGGSKVLA